LAMATRSSIAAGRTDPAKPSANGHAWLQAAPRSAPGRNHCHALCDAVSADRNLRTVAAGGKPKRPANRGMHHSRKAAGCKASSKSLRCRSAKPSPLPLPPVDGPKAGIRIAGQTPPGRSSRLLAQSLRSEDFTRMIAKIQKTLTAANQQGSQPVTPEPAPPHRLWASAWAPPLAEAITLTRTLPLRPQTGTFLPCCKTGHFHFALTKGVP
jgi:hypothetical protein